MIRSQILPYRSLSIPQITTLSLANGNTGVFYQQQLSSTGGTYPFTWSITSASPNTGSWMSINLNTGVFSGTPGTAETETVTIRVTDAIGNFAYATYQFIIQSTVVITTSSPLPSATVGSAYSQTMTATGGTPPYTWAITSDTPDTGAWLSINASTGVLSGTPGTAETESLTIQASDSLAIPSAPTNFQLTVNTAGPGTFDFYISPTGLDTNAGTLQAPWSSSSLSLFAVATSNHANPAYPFSSQGQANCLKTAGKKIGFLPGTYNIGGAMFNDPVTGAMQIIGGTTANPTLWASSDANGNYSRGTATLNASYNGLFGGAIEGPGHFDGPIISGVGGFPQSYATGNFTIDGLKLTGFSSKAIRIGGQSAADGPHITNPYVIQNCEIYGGSANVGASLDNYAAIWIDGSGVINTVGPQVLNNYIHDYVSWHVVNGGQNNMDHLDGIIVWGFGAPCYGTVIQNNTLINAGNIYGKEGCVQGTTVAYNYVDCSMYTSGAYGISDFTGNAQSCAGSTFTDASFIHHNIVLSTGFGIQGIATLSNSNGWQSPVSYYNNTIVNSGSQGCLYTGASTPGRGGHQVYNNIIGSSPIKVNPLAIQIWDYNLIATGMQWDVLSDANIANTANTQITASAFSAAVLAGTGSGAGPSGVEAHSVSGAATYVGGTPLNPAVFYQLTTGSLGKGTGSTTGTTGGTACDMGAWGNISAGQQIGSSLLSFSPASGYNYSVSGAPAWDQPFTLVNSGGAFAANGSAAPTLWMFDDFRGGTAGTQMPANTTGVAGDGAWLAAGQGSKGTPFWQAGNRTGSGQCMRIFNGDTVARPYGAGLQIPGGTTGSTGVYIFWAENSHGADPNLFNGTFNGNTYNNKFWWLSWNFHENGNAFDEWLQGYIGNPIPPNSNGWSTNMFGPPPPTWFPGGGGPPEFDPNNWNSFEVGYVGNAANPTGAAGLVYSGLANAGRLAGFVQKSNATFILFPTGTGSLGPNDRFNSLDCPGTMAGLPTGTLVDRCDIAVARGNTAYCRVMLANSNTLASITSLMYCDIVSWSSTSITCNLRRGGFGTTPAGTHLWWVDAANNWTYGGHF